MNICLIYLFFLISFAKSDTNIYIQNNSHWTLKFNSFTQTGAPLSPQRWGHIPTTRSILPGQRVKVTWFSRGTGITNGRKFLFTQSLQAPWTNNHPNHHNNEIQVQQEIVGTLLHSTMKHKISGIFQTDWTTDRSTKEIKKEQERFYLIYTAYFTGGDDDIEYVIFQPAKFSTGQRGSEQLGVFAYNLYMRYPKQAFLDGQMTRAGLIPRELERSLNGDKFDVIIFSEAFDPESRAKTINGLKKLGYIHYTPNVGERGVVQQDGGVFIMSRWPITKHTDFVFTDCSGADCLAQKGVVYVRITKPNGKNYHVFGTHLQAWATEIGHDVRIKQLRQIMELKRRLPIPRDETVVYAGDFNIDKIRFPEQEKEMRKILVAESAVSLGPLKYTFDPLINHLAVSEEKTLIREILDYVFYSTNHRKPIADKSFIKTYLFRSKTPWRTTRVSAENWENSDHFPVYSLLHFSTAETEKTI